MRCTNTLLDYYTDTLSTITNMLDINNLSFSYPRQKLNVIDRLSMTFEPDGIYGLLGPNGAGKSTLLYLICGLLTPKSGTVTLDGVDTRLRNPRTTGDICIVPEEFDMPKMRLSKYLKIWCGFYPKFSHDNLVRNLEMFGIERDPQLNTLSMGQKKKVYMCIALAANTSLLVMDEPTNGLDIPSMMSFRSFIASNMSDDRTVIISTHQVQDIATLIDHVAIIDRNKILLNTSIVDISERLAFCSTSNPDMLDKALYSQPTTNGYDTILPGGEVETEVNLVSLYQFVTTKPEIAHKIFQNPSL